MDGFTDSGMSHVEALGVLIAVSASSVELRMMVAEKEDCERCRCPLDDAWLLLILKASFDAVVQTGLLSYSLLCPAQ